MEPAVLDIGYGKKADVVMAQLRDAVCALSHPEKSIPALSSGDSSDTAADVHAGEEVCCSVSLFCSVDAFVYIRHTTSAYPTERADHGQRGLGFLSIAPPVLKFTWLPSRRALPVLQVRAHAKGGQGGRVACKLSPSGL